MGNGRSIRVWQDKWVPQPSTFKQISSPDGVPTDAKVSSLIVPLRGTWHMDMIKQAFSTDDAARILSIPLSSRQLEDCLIWAITPKGNFTVRSAYKVALSAVSSAQMLLHQMDTIVSHFGNLFGISMFLTRSSSSTGLYIQGEKTSLPTTQES